MSDKRKAVQAQTAPENAGPQNAGKNQAARGDRYAQARRDWDERFAFHARQAERWRMMAVVTLAIAICAIGFAVWAAVKTEYVPYIVAVDALGRAEAAKAPVTVGDWPVPVVKREIADFVLNFRAIPGDEAVLRSNLRRMLHYMTQGDPADTAMREIGRSPTLSPFVLAKTLTIAVEIVAVNFVGGNSWLVEWRETRRARGTGRILSVARFNGTFVLKRAAKLSPEIITVNPLGIMVAHFDIQKLE